MKNPARIFALTAALATLAYVTVRFVSPPVASPASAPLEKENRSLTRVIDDVGNATENLARSVKSEPATASRAGSEAEELVRLVGELSRANAAQQETIRQLLTKQKSGGGMDDVVTIVGLASTLLTMVLAWRTDRRELLELKAKLAAGPTAA